MAVITIVAAEDDPLAQRAIRTYLKGADDLDLLDIGDSGQAALALVEQLRPDVLITDLHMPGMDGIELLERVFALPDPPKALCFTALGDQASMRAAINAGASGFLLKADPPGLLIQAVRSAHSGDALVSPRLVGQLLRGVVASSAPPPELNQTEADLVRLVGRGLDNATIATTMHLSPSTVKTYVSRVLRRTGCRSRAQLAARAHEWGMVRS